MPWHNVIWVLCAHSLKQLLLISAKTPPAKNNEHFSVTILCSDWRTQPLTWTLMLLAQSYLKIMYSKLNHHNLFQAHSYSIFCLSVNDLTLHSIVSVSNISFTNICFHVSHSHCFMLSTSPVDFWLRSLNLLSTQNLPHTIFFKWAFSFWH